MFGWWLEEDVPLPLEANPYDNRQEQAVRAFGFYKNNFTKFEISRMNNNCASKKLCKCVDPATALFNAFSYGLRDCIEITSHFWSDMAIGRLSKTDFTTKDTKFTKCALYPLWFYNCLACWEMCSYFLTVPKRSFSACRIYVSGTLRYPGQRLNQG